MPRLALLHCACLLALLAWAAPASAQVRRCVDAQGNSVFTDRPCSSMDAAPKAPPVSHSGAYAQGFARRGCARSPEALLDGVRGALEARDVNRLATYYHWAGTGAGAAKSQMDQLEAIVARPLVALQLRYPEPAPEVATPAPDDPARAQPSPPEPAAPLALHLDQMRGAADPASVQLEFGLRQHAGCWWIEL
jgi:hypothetical protein